MSDGNGEKTTTVLENKCGHSVTSSERSVTIYRLDSGVTIQSIDYETESGTDLPPTAVAVPHLDQEEVTDGPSGAYITLQDSQTSQDFQTHIKPVTSQPDHTGMSPNAATNPAFQDDPGEAPIAPQPSLPEPSENNKVAIHHATTERQTSGQSSNDPDINPTYETIRNNWPASAPESSQSEREVVKLHSAGTSSQPTEDHDPAYLDLTEGSVAAGSHQYVTLADSIEIGATPRGPSSAALKREDSKYVKVNDDYRTGKPDSKQAGEVKEGKAYMSLHPQVAQQEPVYQSLVSGVKESKQQNPKYQALASASLFVQEGRYTSLGNKSGPPLGNGRSMGAFNPTLEGKQGCTSSLRPIHSRQNTYEDLRQGGGISQHQEYMSLHPPNATGEVSVSATHRLPGTHETRTPLVNPVLSRIRHIKL